MASPAPFELVVITGLSGSGKSVALNALEDAGYYCVDNIPGRLFNQLVDVLIDSRHARAAITMDARSGDDIAVFAAHIESLDARGITRKLIYLDAKDETLVKRFSETRRKHPLADGQRTIAECIARDRDLLAGAAALADHIDTSDLAPNALRAWVRDIVSAPRRQLTLIFESFGFKNGLPIDADLVFDVRVLPNPYYDPALRALTGQDAPVVAFMQGVAEAGDMLEDIRRYIEKWLPAFVRDNRGYLTVGIGCTGGHHRSVYFAETLARHFEKTMPVLVRHRGLA
jgi:UPF0042 nucleotide-binding protein